MPRTTLDLDSSVLEQLRQQARLQHKSMGQLASERLAVALSESEPAQPGSLNWPVAHLGKPKIDLEDKEAVRRVLEGA